MRILCVHSTAEYFTTVKPLPNQACIPMGLASVATVLQNSGHTIEAAVFTPVTPIPRTVASLLRRVQPRLVCLTAVSTQFPLIRRIARAIKDFDPTIFTVLGGHHASLNAAATIEDTCFDAICIGEGEHAAQSLASSIERDEFPANIRNLWIRTKAGSIEKNALDAFVSDLDSFPIIDRDIWLPHIAVPGRMPSILVGRGCPNRCTYCSNHAMAKLTTGRYVRMRSVDSVRRELDAVVARFPDTSTIYLEIETCGANIKYLGELCAELIRFNSCRSTPVRFGSNLAMGTSLSRSQEILTAMSKAGFSFVNIGLESGCERIRREILRRPAYSNEEIIEFCGRLNQIGIAVNLYILLGLPGETPADFLQTIDVARACQPASVMSNVFYPYPGTDLYALTKDQGMLREDGQGTTLERHSSCLKLKGFPSWRVTCERLIVPYRIFRGRWSMSRIAAAVAKNIIGLSPRLDAFSRRILNANRWMVALQRRMSGSPT